MKKIGGALGGSGLFGSNSSGTSSTSGLKKSAAPMRPAPRLSVPPSRTRPGVSGIKPDHIKPLAQRVKVLDEPPVSSTKATATVTVAPTEASSMEVPSSPSVIVSSSQPTISGATLTGNVLTPRSTLPVPVSKTAVADSQPEAILKPDSIAEKSSISPVVRRVRFAADGSDVWAQRGGLGEGQTLGGVAPYPKKLATAKNRKLEAVLYIPLERELRAEAEHRAALPQRASFKEQLRQDHKGEREKVKDFTQSSSGVAVKIEWRTPPLYKYPEAFEEVLRTRGSNNTFPGSGSTEIKDQEKREANVMRSQYFSWRDVPPTPGEPDPADATPPDKTVSVIPAITEEEQRAKDNAREFSAATAAALAAKNQRRQEQEQFQQQQQQQAVVDLANISMDKLQSLLVGPSGGGSPSGWTEHQQQHPQGYDRQQTYMQQGQPQGPSGYNAHGQGQRQAYPALAEHIGPHQHQHQQQYGYPQTAGPDQGYVRTSATDHGRFDERLGQGASSSGKPPHPDNAPHGPDRYSQVCRFFNKSGGCARGEQCKFRHDSSGTGRREEMARGGGGYQRGPPLEGMPGGRW